MIQADRVLIFTRYYLPGVRAGGPIVTISNLIDLLGDKIEMSLVTENREYKAEVAFEGIAPNRWITVGKSKVFYSRYDSSFISEFYNAIQERVPQIVYLNSLFDIRYTLTPLLLTKLVSRDIDIIVAPRGELNPGALALKKKRKRIYLTFFKLLAKFLSISFQATNSEELELIKHWFPFSRVKILRNFSTSKLQSGKVEKKSGELRVVLVSRISPMKNIDYILDVLKALGSSIPEHCHLYMDIYGFIEDANYWELCQERASLLPGSVSIEYRGGLEQSEVSATIASYHLFFLPTRGENFGHSIAEALAAGVPVLISDRTPWVDLEVSGAGHAIPLVNFDEYVSILHSYIFMDEASYQLERKAVSAYYCKYIQNLMHEIEVEARNLFSVEAMGVQ